MGIKWSRHMITSITTTFGSLNFSNRKILAANYVKLVFDQRYPLVSLLVLNDFYHVTNITAREKSRSAYYHVGSAREEQISFQSLNKNLSRYWIPLMRNDYRFVTCSR